MTIREVASSSTGERVTTYIFNNIEYTHIGSWPPAHIPGFHVPIASVKIMNTNKDITAQVKRFAGPRHVVTNDIIRYAMGRWTWTLVCRARNLGLSLSTQSHLVVPENVPTVVVTDVLGQASIFWAK